MLSPVSIIYGRTVPSAACDYEVGTNFLLRYIQAKEKYHKEISAKCRQPRGMGIVTSIIQNWLPATIFLSWAARLHLLVALPLQSECHR